MTSSTSDFTTSSTGHTEQADEHWADVDHPDFYYDTAFKDFCCERLDSLSLLQHDWDHEGATPIHPEVIGAVREFVNSLPAHVATRPMVVPLSSGNAQLEWHDGLKALELEFTSDDTVHYLIWDPENHVENEAVIPTSQRDELVGLIRSYMKEFHSG